MEIVCEEVTRQFPHEPVAAVDHVSFKVDDGSFVVLLGPSGCGKTTLLKMINRLYEPTSGRILIGGVEVHDLPANQLRRRIGYVIQQVGLFPHMTIEQNIAVVPRLEGWDAARINVRVGELLEMVDLPQTYCRRYPRQLSGGEQQRVGLARALAADPGILLMDEPFAAIDAINRSVLQGELLKIHQRVKKTILFVTHDVEEALRLADRIMVMRAGKCVQYGSPLEILTRPQDRFVYDLVGSGNLLRRLSLLKVSSVTQEGAKVFPSLQNGKAMDHAVRPEEDLRSALSKMLESGEERLPVIDGHGQEIGQLRFEDLRAALAAHTPQPQEDASPTDRP